MVEVKNIEVYGLTRAVNAISNSFNVGEINTLKEPSDNIKKIAEKLGSNMAAHQSHDAWLKGILVSFDMKGNGVFMPEFQRHHFAELIMSQSTMHSMEKFMNSDYDPFTKYVSQATREETIKNYKNWVAKKAEGNKDEIYKAFEILVHNLPRGFELWVTVSANYLALKTIVIQRFHHKNREDWQNFVKACYSMPEFRKLCGFDSPEWNLENW